MLDLKSPEWAHLRASSGGNGVLTAELLAELYAGDANAWGELCNQVCHQNTVGEVAYVAAPHLVEIAVQAGPHLKALVLFTIGDMEASRQAYPRNTAPIRPEWLAEYQRACADARSLAARTLQERGERVDTILLIAALAGLHGHANVAILLQSGPEPWCPECGEPIAFGEGE